MNIHEITKKFKLDLTEFDANAKTIEIAKEYRK